MYRCSSRSNVRSSWRRSFATAATAVTKSRTVQVSLLVGVGAGIALSLYDSFTDAEEKKKVQSQEQKKIVPVIPKVSNMPIVSLPDVNFFMEIVTGIQFYITLYSYSLSLQLQSLIYLNFISLIRYQVAIRSGG